MARWGAVKYLTPRGTSLGEALRVANVELMSRSKQNCGAIARKAYPKRVSGEIASRW